MKILSIDFGTKKIGLSLGDFYEKKIKLLSPLKKDKGFREKLMRLIELERINFILIGIPSPPEPEKSWIYKKILKFAFDLKKNLNFQLILFSEEDTSKNAREKFKKRRGSIHSLSSKILLERFFGLK